MYWEDIIGNTETVAMLKALVHSGKLPHALLFAGPAGVGKLRCAQVMAAAALCLSEHDRPCGVCPSCRQFSYNNHPDFFLLQPDGTSIKIDQMRELQGKLAMAAGLSSRRICIINDAEYMTEEAANSLLKILEEPPGQVSFILVAALPDKLPRTVLSRCQRFRFQPLPYTQLEKALIIQGVDPGRAGLAARLSGCRFGLALAFCQPDGLAEREQALDIVENLATADMSWLWTAAQQLAQDETTDTLAVLQFLLCLFRDLTVLVAAGDRQLLLNIDIIDRLQALAHGWPERQAAAACQEVRLAVQALEGNANTRLTWEALLIRLTDLAKEGQKRGNGSRRAV